MKIYPDNQTEHITFCTSATYIVIRAEGSGMIPLFIFLKGD